MESHLNSIIEKLRRLNRQGLYPMMLASLLAVGLSVMRVYLSHSWIYLFLIWNLFLAWIPYFSSLWAARWYHQSLGNRWRLVIPIGLFVAFFPNAPYLITDLQHLGPRPLIPLWYDVGMLAIFAWTGLFLAMFSLRILHMVIKNWFGPWIGWLFVVNIMGLSGVGVYLGRFLRWNSWDLILYPREVLADTVRCFSHPLSSPGPFGVVLLFGAFLLVSYLMLLAFPSSEELRG